MGSGIGWNSYIDVLISASLYNRDRQSYIERGCLIGLNGVRWTDDDYPNSLKPSSEECLEIAKFIRSKKFAAIKGGVRIESQWYYLIEDELECIGSTAIYCQNPRGRGIIMQSSRTGIVMATCMDIDRYNALDALSYIAGYLESVGC